MITINTNRNIFYSIVSEKITEEDFEKLKPALEKLINENQKVRWYYQMEDFDGWEVKTFFEATQFSLSHRNDFERIAMVGEKKWQEWMTEIMKPFTSAEVKYFSAEERDDARKWIEE